MEQTNVEVMDIPGFHGYRVTSDGVVLGCRKRVHDTVSGKITWRTTEEWRRLSTQKDDSGHLAVMMCKDKRSFRRHVHRLVLLAFVGPCPDGMEACHFPDRDPENNRLENLRWDTRKANHADAIFHGTKARGEKVGTSRLTEDGVRSIRRDLLKGIFQRDIAKSHGVSQTAVSMINRNLYWKHVT